MLSSQTEDLSLAEWMTSALRHWRLIVLCAFASSLVVAGFALSGRRTYTSEVWFRPQAQDPSGVGNLAGVAARFGVPVGPRDAGPSADFFAALLKTKTILGSAVDTRYQVVAGSQSSSGQTGQNLTELFDVPSGPRDRMRELAIRALQNSITTSVAEETGIVKLSVTTMSPGLSVAIAQRLVDLVNQFNIESARTRAAAQRAFTEEQLDQARSTLRSAEDNQQSFREHNRDFRTSLPLQFEDARLGREIDQRQQVLISLTQAYNQSRLDEVRTMPVIALVERPTKPVFPNPRHVISKVAMGLLAGATFGILLALVMDFRGERAQVSADQRLDQDTMPKAISDLPSMRAAAAARLRLIFRRHQGREVS